MKLRVHVDISVICPSCGSVMYRDIVPKSQTRYIAYCVNTNCAKARLVYEVHALEIEATERPDIVR